MTEGWLQIAAEVAPPTLWVYGVHGGSGESRIAALCPTWVPTDHAWPAIAGSVLLVARTHAAGLLAAHGAIAHWAAGAVPHVRLVGLVLVADAPGRLPRPLADLQRQVAAGVERSWQIGWSEAERLCVDDAKAPGVDQLLRELAP